MPTTKCEEGNWIHPSRLPLGGGWYGYCSAPGHEGVRPTADELTQLCNLGYATTCSRLPKTRASDAVRFSVAGDRSARLVFWFVCESNHLPASHGTLEYDLSSEQWVSTHPDPRIQKMADCYLQSYRLRRTSPFAGITSSTNP